MWYIPHNGLQPAKQFMTLFIEPEIGVPFTDDTPNVDLKERAEAACSTAQKLAEHGLDIEPTGEDEDTAAKLALAYADNPEKTSKKVTTKKAAKIVFFTVIQHLRCSCRKSLVQPHLMGRVICRWNQSMNMGRGRVSGVFWICFVNASYR